MIVGDKVICVDNEGAEDTLIKDTVYTVSTMFNDGFIEVSNMKCHADRFKSISDLERMFGYIGFKNVNKGLKRGNKMKIIRRLEDFDKLENGMGLKVFIDNNDKTLSVGIPWKLNLINRISLSEVDNEIIALIKAMGFEFEWKPKRTLEEVLADYTEKPFEFGKDNYVIVDRGLGLRIEHYRTTNFIGAKYYSYEDAKKICEELNS